MIFRLFQNMGRLPDAQQSLLDYRALAVGYDNTVSRVLRIRRDAVDSLELKPGDRVLDVAFGTGDTLLMLAERVAPHGQVVGIEQSADMATIAMRKIKDSDYAGVIDIRVCPASEFRLQQAVDAALFSFTHDVLQHPAAVTSLMSVIGPQGRVVVAGLKFLPWWWGWPINLFNAVRARRYMTSYRGLRRPWEPLQASVPDLRVVRSYLLGSCYLAVGQKVSSNPRSPQADGSCRDHYLDGQALP